MVLEYENAEHLRVSEHDRESPAPRTSALDDPPRLPPPVGLPGFSTARRRSTASQSAHLSFHDAHSIPLTQSASAISGHREADKSDAHAIRHGAVVEASEIPPGLSEPPSPSTRPPSPDLGIEENVAQGYREVGRIASWRGAIILLVTCGAQLMDNVFMTGTNIALPAIKKSFDVEGGDLQWVISAYTLSFGGFLLLSGVLSDRYGRKHIFCAGMAMLCVWTLADALATSFIQLAIFRALQGIGAAMTVPSAVGMICNYFVAQDRTLALTVFGAAGAVGFCLGLIFGGFLTSSLGWRYIFYVAMAITGGLGVIGIFFLPKDREEGNAKPKLDFIGAGLSTGGLILLSFVLSSGGVYGWGKAFIIVLLVLSIAMLGVFTWVETKVPNPIMPLSLWKIQNFAQLWISGFGKHSRSTTQCRTAAH